jgi:hypothetical protein
VRRVGAQWRDGIICTGMLWRGVVNTTELFRFSFVMRLRIYLQR